MSAAPRPGLADAVVRAAADSAARPRVASAKRLIDPKPSPRGRLPDLPPGPPTLSVSGPLRFRPFVNQQRMTQALQHAGAALPAATAARAFARVERDLAGRRIGDLSNAELVELREAIRRTCARNAPGAERLQRELVRRALLTSGGRFTGGLSASAYSADTGVWLYFHSNGPTGTVIHGVSFVPFSPRAVMPKSIPDPASAGLTGRTTWVQPDGRVLPTPPTVPVPVTRARSGLSPNALSMAPDLILDEVRRADADAALAAARLAAVAVRPSRNRLVSPLDDVGAQSGTGILSIIRRRPEGQGTAWDEAVTVRGVTMPSDRLAKVPAHDLDKVLPRRLPDAFQGYARCHLWGRILGSESLAGLAYAPHQAANLLQRFTVEETLRWSTGRAFRGSPRASVPLEVTAYLQNVRVGARKLPFVRTVNYTFDLDDGSRVRAFITIDADGKVTKGIYSL